MVVLILVRLNVGILWGRTVLVCGCEFGWGLCGGGWRIRIRICGCGGLILGFGLVFGCLGLACVYLCFKYTD